MYKLYYSSNKCTTVSNIYIFYISVEIYKMGITNKLET